MPKSQQPRGFNPMTDLGSMARGSMEPGRGYVPTEGKVDSSRAILQRQKLLAQKLRGKK